MSGIEVRVECLKEVLDAEGEGSQCEHMITVYMDYEPEDRSVGITRGYWSVGGDIKCPHHALDKDDLADIENRAIDEAQEQAEAEYDGPDGPNDLD